MKVYISLPITGYDIDKRKKYAEDVKTLLEMETVFEKIITPFDINGYAEGQTWEWYLALDLDIISQCDAIVMLPGWDKSQGCRLEHQWAVLHNKEIINSSEQILKYKKQ